MALADLEQSSTSDHLDRGCIGSGVLGQVPHESHARGFAQTRRDMSPLQSAKFAWCFDTQQCMDIKEVCI